jgi:hypothetical protein
MRQCGTLFDTGWRSPSPSPPPTGWRPRSWSSSSTATRRTGSSSDDVSNWEKEGTELNEAFAAKRNAEGAAADSQEMVGMFTDAVVAAMGGDVAGACAIYDRIRARIGL